MPCILSQPVYLLLGVSVSLWFRQCTVETCTLNWVRTIIMMMISVVYVFFLQAGYLASDNIPLKIFSYLIVLFPTFACLSFVCSDHHQQHAGSHNPRQRERYY